MRCFIILCSLLFIGLHAHAGEIGGVVVQETVQTESGAVLKLNGAGIRTKFFMDIYLAELYMEHPETTTETILAAEGRKRIVMHILYKEISLDKLVDAWNEGFANNTAKEKLEALQGRITQFNAMFETVTKNQVLVYDYVPEQGTKVTIAGVEKGIITGKDFNDALLTIWLGKKPVTKSLKKALLNYKK